MTQNFRKTLMATTMLAGLAISTLDAAQAGPNGGPSLGSISGFSSMRMDFNRIGGSNRALSRDDMRVVPLEVKKTIPSGITPLPGKKDDKKNIAKKDQGTNVARASNPKSVSGKGKKDVGNGPILQINPAIVEAYAVTGGNLGDLSRFDEFAKRLGLGPLVVNVPFLPGNDGSFDWPVDKPDTEQHRFDPNSLMNFYPSAPGQPDTSKTGQAAGDEWRVERSGSTDRWEYWYREYNKSTGQTRDVYANDNGETGQTMVVTTERNGTTTTEITTTNFDSDGNSYGTLTYRRVDIAQPVVITGDPDSEDSGDAGEEEEPSNEKDSQPVAEGSGRPSNNGGGWCSPTGGCYRPARNAGPRIIPTETQGRGTTARWQSPGWATDPNPDGLGGTGGGSGYSGYRPENEEGGDIGGPGNPETGGSIGGPSNPPLL